MIRCKSWPASGLLLILLSSCGAGPVRPESSENSTGLLAGISTEMPSGPKFPQPSETTPLNIPALPDPASLLSLPRDASFTLADGFATGAAYSELLPSQRVSRAVDSGVFAPAWPLAGGTGDQIAFAIYPFSLPSYAGTPVKVSLDWADAPGAGSAYIALGNFDSSRWNWFEVPDNQQLSFNQFAEYITDTDTCLLAILCIGTDAVLLDSIQISTPQAPQASIVPDADSGIVPFSVNFDAGASLDPDGTIDNYEWDLDGDGLFNESGPELDAGNATAASFQYEAAGSYLVTVRVTDDDGLQDEASVEINASLSQPPVADLQSDVFFGQKPLIVTFNATGSSDPDGSVVDYEWDFDGDNSYNEAGDELNAKGDPTPLPVTYTTTGSWDVHVRVTDNDGGQDVATKLIFINNVPPVPTLLSDLNEGDAPLAVTFDASTAFDPDGTIVKIEWDFDGDDIYNEPATPEETEFNNALPAPVILDTPGNAVVHARFTDDENDTSIGAVLILVHGWELVSLDNDTPGGGYYPQMMVINNQPVIAHATIPFTVRYGVCSDLFGLDPDSWTFIEIDSTNAPGRSCSLASIAGNPAVAYFNDAAGNGFSYKRSTTQLGAAPADWPAAVHFGSGTDGLDVSLAEVNGKAAIAYDAGSVGDLGYQFSSTDSGMSPGDWTAITVEGDATNTYGQHPDLKVINGKPAIAYRMTDNGGSGFVRYAYSSTVGGTAPGDWTKISAASLGNGISAWYPALADINGNPAIAYSSFGLDSISYVRASTANGSAWNAPVLVHDPAAGSDEYPALILNGSKPAIAYTNSNTNDPYFVVSNTASGENVGDWSNHTNIRPGAHPEGRMAFLGVQASGHLVVLFRDETDECITYGVLF